MHAFETGRDKPVPYGRRAGFVHAFDSGRDKPVPYKPGPPSRVAHVDNGPDTAEHRTRAICNENRARRNERRRGTKTCLNK